MVRHHPFLCLLDGRFSPDLRNPLLRKKILFSLCNLFLISQITISDKTDYNDYKYNKRPSVLVFLQEPQEGFSVFLHNCPIIKA